METELVSIELEVNKIRYKKTIRASMTLLDFLREDLRLKERRGMRIPDSAEACTIIMDGKTVNACLILAIQADGKEILTIEGLSSGGGSIPLASAFVEEGAVQCGFCGARDDLIGQGLARMRKKIPLERRSGKPFREPLPLHRLCPNHQSRQKAAP